MKTSSAFIVYNHQYKRRNFSQTKVVEDQLDEDFVKARKLIHFTRVTRPQSNYSKSSQLNIVHYSRPNLSTPLKSCFLKHPPRSGTVSLPKMHPKPEDGIHLFPLDKSDSTVITKIDKYFKADNYPEPHIRSRFASTYSSMDFKQKPVNIYNKLDPKPSHLKAISNSRSDSQLIRNRPCCTRLRDRRSPSASKHLNKYDEMSIELEKMLDKASNISNNLEQSPKTDDKTSKLSMLEYERRLWKKLRKTNKSPFISLNDIKKSSNTDQEFINWISDVLAELKA